MNDKPVIALDAAGGDGDPSLVVEAAEIARKRYPRTRFLFFGPEAAIAAAVDGNQPLKSASEIVHTDEAVLPTDRPSQVLRRGRTTSMGLAIDAVKTGRAHAAVSAGNTGALMAMAKLALRTMPGIDRPALAALLPTLKSDSVMLDLGANTECSPENLVQFAVMGAAFARILFGVQSPRVALLNIGEEELKGTDELKEAAALLRGSHLPMQFVGFIEGDKIGRGDVDVIVTDGFSGNIALKTAEGTARLVVELLRNAFKSSAFSKIGFLLSGPAIRALRRHLDPNNHNGAVFLGLNGLVVKSHGSASATGFANAIGVAHDLVVHDIARRIASDLENFRQDRGDEPSVSPTAAGASAA